MEFDGGDCGCGIVICDGQCFATGSGAAVKDLGVVVQAGESHEGGDKLRGFVLDDDLSGAVGLGFRDVSGVDAAGGREKRAGSESDPFLSELCFSDCGAEADCGRGNGLIVQADLLSGGDAVFTGPAFDQP